MGQSDIQEYKDGRFLIPALIIFILFAWANLGEVQEFWGFNFLKSFPLFARIIVVALIAVLFVPAVARLLTKTSLVLSQKICEHRNLRVSFQIIFMLVFLALFYYFSSKITLLGDGTLRKNQIGNGEMWLPVEFLDFFIHAFLYKYVFSPLDLTATACYRAVSIVSGLFFIDGLWRLGFYLDKEKGLIYFLLLLSSGITVFFFGYVESYSIAAALLPYVMLAALKALDGKTGVTGFLVLYLLLGLVHIVPAFILGLGMLLVLFMNGRKSRPDLNRISFYLGGLVVLAVVSGYIMSFVGVEIFRKSLLPLTAGVDNGQALLSVNHILNLLNWVFLSALGFLLLIWPVLRNKADLSEVNSVKIFTFGWVAVSASLFMIFYTPQLGGPRDWDIFSLPAFLLLIAAVVIFAEKNKSRISGFIWPVIATAFVSTFSFALINSSPVKSAERFEEVIQVSRFKSLFNDYVHLLNYTNSYLELKDLRKIYEVKVLEEAEDKQDSAYALRKISQIYAFDHQREQALNFIFRALMVDSLDFQSHVLLMRYSQEFGQKEHRLMVAGMLERHFPGKADARMDAGILYAQSGDNKAAEINFERAYELDSSDFKVVSNYATFKLKLRDYEKGLALLTRAMQIEPESFSVCYNLSVVFQSLNQDDKAREYLTKAEKLASTNQEKQLIDEQREKLGL